MAFKSAIRPQSTNSTSKDNSLTSFCITNQLEESIQKERTPDTNLYKSKRTNIA